MQYKEDLISNQTPQSQTENEETPRAEYPNEGDSEDTGTNKTSAIFNFMPITLLHDKYVEGINS